MAQMLGAGPGQVLVVRPERLALADAGVPGMVRERRYTGAAAFYLVETRRAIGSRSWPVGSTARGTIAMYLEAAAS